MSPAGATGGNTAIVLFFSGFDSCRTAMLVIVESRGWHDVQLLRSMLALSSRLEHVGSTHLPIRHYLSNLIVRISIVV